MNGANQPLTRDHLYQVWVTSWAEDGSKEAQAAEATCPRFHATNRLVGQVDTINEAVRIFNANESYEPYITKLVTWHTKIVDVTESPTPKEVNS